MKQPSKLKILNDPIYGFISIPNEDVYNLIEHPYFQRLRRITQMGLSYLVYPGAHHTRFHHALGCLHLMQKAVQVLRNKEVEISNDEEDALYKAILMHDIGHGPFSHALENLLVTDTSHEEISLLYMEELNRVFNGSLTLAIEIFKGAYHRPFMLDLISSQLDIDRLDYLKRDSFYTGVAEGNINSQRLISMLNVVDDQLVVEEKALYSVENFLSGRRLMYWQVYLHKTGIGAEHLLQSVIKRVHELLDLNKSVHIPMSLKPFFEKQNFDLNKFAQIDDSDVLYLLKSNRTNEDQVLRELCTMILNRQLLKIKFSKKPISKEKIDSRIEILKSSHGFSSHEAAYFVFSGMVTNTAYAKAKPIKILSKTGKIKEFLKASKEPSFKALGQSVSKHYYCYPKSQD